MTSLFDLKVEINFRYTKIMSHLFAGCVLALIFSLGSAFYSSSLFKQARPENLKRPPLNRALSMSEGDNVVKLPVVQLVRDNVIMGEFVMGSNMERSMSMLQATIEAEVSQYAEDKSVKGHGVDNIYSDDHLLDVFSRGSLLVVFKLYRDGCKKCAAFDPVFHDMAKKIRFPEGKVKWIKADMDNVPDYSNNVKARLLGKDPSASS